MRLLITSLICSFTLCSHANVIQYFSGINYNNPSELTKIKTSELIFGGTWAYADLKFAGSALNFNTMQYDSGVVHSKTSQLTPYGRIAKRLNQKFVFSVDVTQPFNSNIDWGDNSFTRYAAQTNYLYDVDVSPKLAFSINQKWHIGGGVNFNFIKKNKGSWALPTGPTTYASLVNVSSNLGVGYNLGLTYIMNPTNIFGLTYYSRISQSTTGYSTLANLASNMDFHFFEPATTLLSYVHIFNPTWLINLEIIQSEWSANKIVNFNNTAGPPPFTNFTFTNNFSNSFAYLAAVRKQYNEKLGLTLLGMIDNGPEQDYLRSIFFPAYVQYFVGFVADYHFTKTTSIEFLYGHDFSNPPIHNQVMLGATSVPFTTGQVNINADVIDLKLKIEA